jgi:AcrR family transcriptional regulator
METLVTNKVSLVLHPLFMIMEIQERILHKSHELFMRYGIRSVSMDEIAAHLGISKKTIYQFYEDKDALVEDVIKIEIDRNETECASQQNSSDNAIHEVLLAVNMMEELLKVMNPAVIYELEKYHSKAYKKLNDHKAKFLYDTIKENLERGKREGLYREDINTDILTRFRIGTTFFIFNPDVFNPGKHSHTAVLNEITENFLYGIATAKGQKIIQKYLSSKQKQPHL